MSSSSSLLPPMPRCVHRDAQGHLCQDQATHRRLKLCPVHAKRFSSSLPPSRTDTSPPKALKVEHKPPPNWRVTLCENFATWGHCTYGFTCAFAHSKHHLRAPGSPFPAVVYVPQINRGEAPPPPPSSPTPLAPTSPTPPLTRLSAQEVEPELCLSCFQHGDEARYADERWTACGHVLCSSCVAQSRKRSVTRASPQTCHVCHTAVSLTEQLPQAAKLNLSAPPAPKPAWNVVPAHQHTLTSPLLREADTLEYAEGEEEGGLSPGLPTPPFPYPLTPSPPLLPPPQSQQLPSQQLFQRALHLDSPPLLPPHFYQPPPPHRFHYIPPAQLNLGPHPPPPSPSAAPAPPMYYYPQARYYVSPAPTPPIRYHYAAHPPASSPLPHSPYPHPFPRPPTPPPNNNLDPAANEFLQELRRLQSDPRNHHRQPTRRRQQQ
ncbi:hypothetical protein BASA81_006659 [Batrachochytrium salamandrivorans]|nr:hypothetical protein BASA81_006659 [Batrachochytrium salamandrivorans]